MSARHHAEHAFAKSDSRFEVVGGVLKHKHGKSLNYEDGSSPNVGVTATDSHGNSVSETISIAVQDISDAPVAATVNLGAIEEDGGSRIITESELLAGVTDKDGPSLSITELSIEFGNGTLDKNTDGTWTYAPEAGDDTNVVFSYTATDGSNDASATATLNITPVHGTGDTNDRVFTGNDDDVISTGGGNDWGCSGGGNDTVNAGSGNDWVFAGWGDDLVIHVASNNEGSWEYYAGGRGHDTLRLVVAQEIYDSEAFQRELTRYQTRIDIYGSASGRFWSLGVGFSSFEVIQVDIEDSNVAPAAIALDNLIDDESEPGTTIRALLSTC